MDENKTGPTKTQILKEAEESTMFDKNCFSISDEQNRCLLGNRILSSELTIYR